MEEPKSQLPIQSHSSNTNTQICLFRPNQERERRREGNEKRRREIEERERRAKALREDNERRRREIERTKEQIAFMNKIMPKQ